MASLAPRREVYDKMFFDRMGGWAGAQKIQRIQPQLGKYFKTKVTFSVTNLLDFTTESSQTLRPV